MRHAQIQMMMKMVLAIVQDNPFHAPDVSDGDEAAEIWTCRNPTTGEIFGKFSALQMFDWSKKGCFSPNLECKHDGMPAFEPLIKIVTPHFISSVPPEFKYY